jgi:hypothetical protein
MLFSCEDYFDGPPREMGNGTLLKEALINGETHYKYTYNEAGFVLEEKTKFHYSKYTYNSLNKIIQSDHYWDERLASSSSYVLDELAKVTQWISPENAEKDSYHIYQYGRDGHLKKISSYRLNNGYSDVTVYSFNKKGRISRSTYFHNNKEAGFRNYFYDSRGNLIKEQHYCILNDGTEQLQTTTEYTLDNKINPYYSFRKLLKPGRNTNPNNIIKQTYRLHMEVDDFIDKVQVTEYDYKYNSSGYPTQMMEGWDFVYY